LLKALSPDTLTLHIATLVAWLKSITREATTSKGPRDPILLGCAGDFLDDCFKDATWKI